MSEDFLSKITNEFDFDVKNIHLFSPLVLAYVGDAVYEVYVRTLLVCGESAPVHKLHKRSISFVKAKSQSDILHRIMESLDHEEQEIVRRGRNAKSGTIPKNADVTEYKHATAFETLIGYLYLKKDFDRLMQILKMAVADIKIQDGKS
ncbi:MAG: Mini-ribonuclease 3 [Clostridia bacterium]|nr:Mini-ribonuclease 3 [Clostridia bacterium]